MLYYPLTRTSHSNAFQFTMTMRYTNHTEPKVPLPKPDSRQDPLQDTVKLSKNPFSESQSHESRRKERSI